MAGVSWADSVNVKSQVLRHARSEPTNAMKKSKLKQVSPAARTAGSQQRGARSRGHSASTIQRHLRHLRKLIDESGDPHEQRLAYAMETAIRWATTHTVGWGCMAKEAALLAELLKKDVARTPNDQAHGSASSPQLTKPPLGCRPRWIAEEMRLIEVASAVSRYMDAGKPVPPEWVDELIHHIGNMGHWRAWKYRAAMTPNNQAQRP